ncbi:hypothetical protein L208DRAFT_1374320 [Tricholoma matsutake]|nr:hypothetical protein L208DRAFT_1374320 [Tricholoma matsutake 945]
MDVYSVTHTPIPLKKKDLLIVQSFSYDIPAFLFCTIQPESVQNALKEAMTSQAAVDAVRDDIEDIANHVHDMHPEQEVRDAARRLFPCPREEANKRDAEPPLVLPRMHSENAGNASIVIELGGGIFTAVLPVHLDPSGEACA